LLPFSDVNSYLLFLPLYYREKGLTLKETKRELFKKFTKDFF